MSEVKMISPLLDDMFVEKERVGHDGQTYHILRNHKTGEQFVLKKISLPESDSRIRALILSGAYANEQAVHEYYGRLCADIRAELQIGQELSAGGSFAGVVSYQAEPKDTGVGYDIYMLYPLNISLSEFLAKNAMTHLRALNLGIDLCDSILACREAGYLFQNIRPETVFLMPNGKFLLGDLGLTSLEYLEYASVPEEYLGTYSAPELSDITACPNLTVDLYSLGMVLYRIYNGNHGPFEDESTNAAMAEKLRLSGKPLPTPIYADYELAEIILKACTFKQDQRYQTPEELKQALTLYMQRNAVSDELIAPPIIADLDPVPLIDEEIEEEPIRMTDVETLDEEFRQSFAPDLSGSGDDAPERPQKPEAIPEPPVEEAAKPKAASFVVPEEPKPETAQDPDQMDINALLASVSVYMDEAKTVEDIPQKKSPTQTALHPQDVKPSQNSLASQVAHDYVDAAHDEEPEPENEDEPETHKRPRIVLWALIIAILAGIGLVAYFLLNWYFVEVTELKTVHTTPTQIMVELVTPDDPKYFTVTCTDAFGNTYEGLRSGKQYCFTDLKDNSTYTISVAAAKSHNFYTAAPKLTESTNEYTTISDISFARTDADGEVQVSFKHTGPAPEKWKVTYWKENERENALCEEFEGNSIVLSDLALYETYEFTIEDAGGVYIMGENTGEYQLYPHISANTLLIEDVVGNDVKLVWEFDGTAPNKWNVLCTADGMETITQSTEELTATFTVPDFSKAYTFYLTALGMDEPIEAVLDANPILVNNLTALPKENGEIVVTWDTPAGEPSDGWIISYKLKNFYYKDDVPCVKCPSEDENSVTLQYLPADAQYEIELVPVDSVARSFGVMTTEAKTLSAAPFADYQTLPAAPYGDGTDYASMIALWEKPAKEIWDYRDLNTPRRTNYSVTESIAFCIEILSCDLSTAVRDNVVHLTYAVRNEAGQIVALTQGELPWSGVWFDRRHDEVIPTPYSATEVDESGAPLVLTGKFTLEVYINGKLLAHKGFVLEA